MGGSGDMQIDRGEPYFGGGAGAIPQDMLAGLGVGGSGAGANGLPTTQGGAVAPTGALGALFQGASQQPARQRAQLAPITQPTQPGLDFRMPNLPAPSAPVPAQGSGVPAGYTDVGGQRYQGPYGSMAQQEFGGPPMQFNGPYRGNTDGGAPGALPEGTLKSVFGNQYLLPGQPGYPTNFGPGSMAGGVGGGAAGGGAPLSQAAQLARLINQRAANRP